MKYLSRLFAVLLLVTFAGCSSTAPPSASSPPQAAAQPTPLQEPYPAILARWNFYRQAAGVPPIVAQPELNQAALHHAQYLVNNRIAGGDANIENGRIIETG